VTASTERTSPLAAWSERFVRASASPRAFSIQELAFTTQINLRGDAADAGFASGVRQVIGCDLPGQANTFAVGSAGAVIWLGPDEWLVAERADRGDDIAASLRHALSGRRHSVTDVSAARTVIEIAGAAARLVLAKGCPIDVHANVLAPPRTAQTLLAKTRVLIQCCDAAPKFRLFVASSFAAYLAEWLVDAAAECAASRALDNDRIAARLA
jgi:sarcosine oxidase subunit gamma